ncbi:MAG: hypothetical protein K6E91_01165 [Butyrivibrio sp.]|nr:hypothetical protein [Butyrivibrio sp.]
MNKRLREYLRHLERLDYEALSEEELILEREELDIKLTEMHNEMVRILIPTTGLFICACMFLAAAFVHPYYGSYIAAVVMFIGVIWQGMRYKTLRDGITQMGVFIDKLIKLT